MFCANCGTKIVGAFCNACGARSVQSDVVPTTERERTFAEKHPFTTVAMVVCVCFVAVTILAAKFTAADSSKYGRTKIGCVCARSDEDVSPVMDAYHNSDVSALYGLIKRGKALNLDEGVKVRRIGDYDGVVDIAIESGYDSGQTCKLPDRFIEWEQ